MLWTAAPIIAAQMTYNSGFNATTRSSTGALLMLSGVAGSVPASTLVGDLYVNMTLSLSNFSTAINTSTNFLEDKKEEIARSRRENSQPHLTGDDRGWEALTNESVPTTTLTKSPLVREGLSMWGRTKSPG